MWNTTKLGKETKYCKIRLYLIAMFAKSAGAVEYTDCISADR